MKRKFSILSLALLMSLLLAISASAAGADAPDRFPAPGGTIGYVTDAAGIMTVQERQSLEQTAQEISQTHGFGVYIITVDSFRDVTDSYDVFDGAATLYNKYGLGFDEDQKGVLLLLSMEERDFSLITRGDYGEYIFDQDTREAMTDYFLDDFSYDAWYDGFADYLSVSNDILADGPDKLQSEINALTGMIFLIPLIPAAIGVFILGRKMKSVAAATQAAAYVSGVPELTVSEDRYTHTTEVRRKIKEDDSDRSGGGVRSRSSGSFSGTSGKF